MKKAKAIKVTLTVYQGTPVWDAIVGCSVPRTTRLHELAAKGVMAEHQTFASRIIVTPPASHKPAGQSNDGRRPFAHPTPEELEPDSTKSVEEGRRAAGIEHMNIDDLLKMGSFLDT
jgi:hypothetical protein